jgi:hypothetical protein
LSWFDWDTATVTTLLGMESFIRGMRDLGFTVAVSDFIKNPTG